MFQRVMKRQENEGGKGGLGRIIINELPGTSGRQQGVVYLTKPTIYQNQKLEWTTKWTRNLQTSMK